jgi:hypothetical protein
MLTPQGKCGAARPPGVGFDCSGLVQAAYHTADISLSRTAQEQFDAGPHLLPGSPLAPGTSCSSVIFSPWARAIQPNSLTALDLQSRDQPLGSLATRPPDRAPRDPLSSDFARAVGIRRAVLLDSIVSPASQLNVEPGGRANWFCVPGSLCRGTASPHGGDVPSHGGTRPR